MKQSGEAQHKRERESQVMDFLKDLSQETFEKFQTGKNRSVSLTVAREQLFLSQLTGTMEKLLSRKYFVGKAYKAKRKDVPTERVLNVMLSDLHFGAMLDKREVPLQYGPTEEARRLAKVAITAADFKRQYRDETELLVHLIGDLIQNQLHDPRDGAPLAEQVAAAIHLLIQCIVFWRSQFKRVRVKCTPGNHGRNTSRHHDRATNQKWDAIETMIYYAVKKGVAHLPDVEVDIPYTPFYTYEVFGMSGFMTHGDTVISPGYPNKAINVENVRKQINEINAKLESHKRHVLFGVGHVHVHSCTKLPGKTYFISNGCLIPTDAYAQSIGITETACCQAMWESVPGRMVGHRFEADVDEHDDHDRSLDKIITPFTGF